MNRERDFLLAAANRKVREEIIADVLNLYNSKPTEQSFRHYSANAQFEDPLQFSGNLSSVKSAFKSLPMIFKDSEVTKSDAEIDTNPLKLMLETRYEWKGIKKETVIRSLVLLTLNEQEEIIRHEERWNGEPIPNAESGFFGRIKEVGQREREMNTDELQCPSRRYVMLREVSFTLRSTVTNRWKRNKHFDFVFFLNNPASLFFANKFNSARQRKRSLVYSLFLIGQGISPVVTLSDLDGWLASSFDSSSSLVDNARSFPSTDSSSFLPFDPSLFDRSSVFRPQQQ